MRNSLILAAIAALAFTSVADAKSCKDAHGKFIACPSAVAAAKGNAVKAAAATKATKMQAAAAKTDAKTAMAASTTSKKMMTKTNKMAATGPRKCSKGKPCGSACIPMDKVCHK